MVITQSHNLGGQQDHHFEPQSDQTPGAIMALRALLGLLLEPLSTIKPSLEFGAPDSSGVPQFMVRKSSGSSENFDRLDLIDSNSLCARIIHLK